MDPDEIEKVLFENIPLGNESEDGLESDSDSGTCKVGLCMQNGRTCFYDYHQK